MYCSLTHPNVNTSITEPDKCMLEERQAQVYQSYYRSLANKKFTITKINSTKITNRTLNITAKKIKLAQLN